MSFALPEYGLWFIQTGISTIQMNDSTSFAAKCVCCARFSFGVVHIWAIKASLVLRVCVCATLLYNNWSTEVAKIGRIVCFRMRTQHTSPMGCKNFLCHFRLYLLYLSHCRDTYGSITVNALVTTTTKYDKYEFISVRVDCCVCRGRHQCPLFVDLRVGFSHFVSYLRVHT